MVKPIRELFDFPCLRVVQVHALLMFDAVNVYAKALRGIGGSKSIKAEPNSCANRSTTGWSSGFRLINYMRIVSNCFTN